jgi:hypothetical protein
MRAFIGIGHSPHGKAFKNRKQEADSKTIRQQHCRASDKMKALEEVRMKSQRNIARQFFGLTLTLVGLMSWNTLPIHLSERTVQAATRARVTEPTGPAVSRAVANGRVAFVSYEGGARSDIYTMEADGSNVPRRIEVTSE